MDKTKCSHLVSIVIPAFNAVETIDATLRSVRSQSHDKLDIIVVDDGSTDATVPLANKHMEQDSRIRLLRQENSGVAAARNLGWRSSLSNLIAFIDADDLWAPEKIEKQLQRMFAGTSPIGVVYTWYDIIDARDRVILHFEGARWEGNVLRHLFRNNFVGNGSSVLTRREVLEYTDGFETALRAQGAQGCEDILFYCRAAERFEFGVVPEHLVGYRELPDNMSSNAIRMLRSWLLVVEEMSRKHGGEEEALRAGLFGYARHLLQKTLSKRQTRQTIKLILLATRHSARLGAWLAKECVRIGADAARRRAGRRLRGESGGSSQLSAEEHVFPRRLS